MSGGPGPLGPPPGSVPDIEQIVANLNSAFINTFICQIDYKSTIDNAQ